MANTQPNLVNSLKCPLIKGINKAAFFTKDADANKSFYNNYLGFAKVDLIKQNTIIKINSRQCVELIPEKISGGNRLSHFAIETNDAVATRRYLLEKKITVSTVSKDKSGNIFFFIQ